MHEEAEAVSERHGEQAVAMLRVCSDCSRSYALVPGAAGSAGLVCVCGGELDPAVLEPGLYELHGVPAAIKRAKKAHHPAPATPREPDQGYNESHGYGPAHGGPTSPGDAPAADEPIEPENPVR